ncbi:MAG: HAD-IIB family hydrolase [Planctomycetota bacterium]
MPRKYDILAIDLDGTLLDRQGMVSGANRLALDRAREAGMRVVICTGRGFAECRHVVERIEQRDPVVVAGGAIIADSATGDTIHRFSIHQSIVSRAVDVMLDELHPALVLKDPSAAGYDYLVVRGPDDLPLDPVTEWWFKSMNVRVRLVRDLAEDEHPEHTVRVGACGLSGVMAGVKTNLHGHFGDEVVIHHFGAVVAPEHASRHATGETLHVLEVFDKDANKWAAVSHVAAAMGVPTSRIAAIGDEINDIVLIKNAGVGISMGNAIGPVRDAATRHTRRNDEDGVAYAVDRLLAGEW